MTALPGPGPGDAADDGHTIYVNPWAGPADRSAGRPARRAAPGPHRCP